MMAAVSALVIALTAATMIILDRVYGLDRPRRATGQWLAGRYAAHGRTDGRRFAARQRLQWRAPCRVLPDGRLSGLLGQTGRRPPGACLLDAAGSRHVREPRTGTALMNTPTPHAANTVIIGAGPAGIRAAQTFLAHGLRPCLVDEGLRGGGQIYRRQPENFKRSAKALYGFEAAKAQAVHATLDQLRADIDYRPETLVWNAEARVLDTLCNGRAGQIPFKHLLVATGATDRILPVPGWTLPGVYSLGAAQIALKFQGCSIGQRVEIEGQRRVSGVTWQQGGQRKSLACDAVAFAHALRSETQLADLLGCEFTWSGLNRAWLPSRDGAGRSSVEGVYLAGDGAGIMGADAAELAGELAALTLLSDIGQRIDPARSVELQRQLEAIQRFRQGLETAFPFPEDWAAKAPDTLMVCRCEEVSAGDIRQTVAEGHWEINRVKAMCRRGSAAGAGADQANPVWCGGRTMSQPTDVDAVVIGGGIVGASAALFLALRGKRVALLERDFFGSHSSGVNYGGVRRQGRPLSQLPLSQRAHEIWGDLRAFIGTDGEYVRSGHLKLARSDKDMASLAAYEQATRGFGLDLQLLDHRQLRARFPWAGDVATDNTQRFRAPWLLNCAGAWAAQLAQQFGEPVPMRAGHPAMLVTEPLPMFMDVSTGVEGGGIYARQVARGNCVLGGGQGFALDPATARPGQAAILEILRNAAELYPPLAGAQAIRTWSGTEGYLPDREPVLGASSTQPGLLHGFGFAGSGFQIGPAAGE
nr:hypothetical protein [Tanacetum cinerariifolium]